MKRWTLMITCIIYLVLYSKNVYAKNMSIPDDAVEFNNHYYKLYDLKITWEEAKIFCESIGGHLATITSQEENSFLYRYITNLNYNSAYFGASDNEIEGVWKWVTDEEFIYSNWHDGEPSNDLNSEHYAMFYYEFADGTWNDGGVYCNARIGQTPYICEWDISNTVTISSPSEETNDNKSINIEININLIGGISILGGISFIVFKLRRKNGD